MGKLLTKFQNKLPSLSYSEKHVFYYIDNNLNLAKTQSLTKMAEVNSVSTTTIIRMCHKLDLLGFSELKYIIKSINQDNLSKNENIIKSIVTDINSTAENINHDDLNELIKMIDRSEKIIIVAVGLTKTIGEYFSKLLMQFNKNSIYIYESHIIDLLPNTLHYKDLVIFISNSGKTQTLISIAEKLSFGNFKTACIVNSPNSPLANLSRLSISGEVEKNEFKGYDITPRSSLVFLIDIIYNSYILFKNKK
ncbi:MurR/RpiR family transcriptional regulator [Clostridium sp. Marseille-Q2269]|uniref:MurR/RpiR family transcriptional regulator n=1 Tax=Clostridium sp. Marseille-Q2269 TaxID=2942205 RepID=UPI002072BF63|nr:MurR/RpiR family transcriptional regulator [Clostridium sp. Marseille-Q2269]